MATDFFAIVALVVTISGVAFTFIVTVRQLSAHVVGGWREKASAYRNTVQAGGATSHKTLAAIFHGILKTAFWVWFLSLLIPIFFLAVYSWCSSSDVLESYYSEEAQQKMKLAAKAPTEETNKSLVVGSPANTSEPPADPVAQVTKNDVVPKGSGVACGLGMMSSEWYATCIDLQMRWLWWIKWLSVAAVAIALASGPVMWGALYVMSLVAESTEGNQGISPQSATGGAPAARKKRKSPTEN